MKHEVTTLNTMKTLSASLKRFMEKKPLNKITVSEIIADCNLNRKTFYYHFADIYDLLKWTLEQEAIEIVKAFDLLVDSEEAIRFVFDYIEMNQHILNCAYSSIGREEMKRFLYSDFIDVVITMIEGIEKELKITVDENFKHFLADFYTEALAGMILNALTNLKQYNKEETIRNIMLICKTSIPSILTAKEKRV